MDCTAYSDKNSSNYIFTGKKVSVVCIYNSAEKVFRVVRINHLSLDRRSVTKSVVLLLRVNLDFSNNLTNTQDIQR